MSLHLGCIADDLTGATDMALALSRNGMATSLSLGVPAEVASFPANEAHVIALKNRTAPVKKAVAEALASVRALKKAGCRQVYFKYCSTFDSTPVGNIGPVIDALLEELDAGFALLCPAFPAAGRTVTDGVLFVDGVPLADSPMRNHSLTPMWQSSIRDLLKPQTEGPGASLITLANVRQGSDAINREKRRAVSDGSRYIVVDAETESDLEWIAGASVDDVLVTGSSGLGAALPGALRKAGLLGAPAGKTNLPDVAGNTAILAGSCSTATLRQIEFAAQTIPAFHLDLGRHEQDTEAFVELCEEILRAAADDDVLVYTSLPTEALRQIQSRLGVQEAAVRAESLLADVASRLHRGGIRRFIVAGGESSGAVGGALDIAELDVGPEIEPGVPWMVGRKAPELLVAFKSGNFGSDDFFLRATEMLP